MTDDLELRIARDDDFGQLGELLSGAFLDDAHDEVLDVERMVFEPDRTHVVADGDRLVATGGVLTREMSVPGAVVPTAHVTAVGVAATHRRRGLLRRIMTAQLEAIRNRGSEPFAVLWASEDPIYGRFGYGLGAWHVSYKIAKLETSLPGEPAHGRLRQVVPSTSRDELAAVYERVRLSRPGYSSRPGRWWEHLTADPKPRRRGMTALRGVLYEVDGRVDGYALWRVKGGWGDTGPSGEVSVNEVVAESPEAYAALWRFLLSIDLTRTVQYMFGAADEPLAHLVTNASGLAASMSPSLWVRIVDVPAALAARRYAAEIDIVLEVADDLLPDNSGRWHLAGGTSSAKCERTDAMPDLSLDVRTLGAAYLAGTSLLSLAAAGRVTEHRQGALYEASAAFGWHRAPVTLEIF
ncbi:MAG TPA: GNAT family N-acetyltransferase [Jiangellaceae bacterium]